jgi:eukaryotic-like serine/threonine-protein kinase
MRHVRMQVAHPLALAGFLAGVWVTPIVVRPQPSQFRGGAAHTGFYATRGVPAFGGLQWRLPTPAPVRSSPTIAGSLLYIGSADGTLYAIDVNTGDVKWQRNVGSAIMSTPAVANGRVFVTGYDGSLRALGATDGQPVWTFRSAKPVPLAWGYESGETYISSPALAGSLVMFGSRDGTLYAVDASTGRERWRYAAGARLYSSPAVANGAVFVGGQDGVLHAVGLADGRSRWRFRTEGTSLHSADFGFDRTTIQSSPAVEQGIVYVGARDGFLYAVEATTGQLRWKMDHKVSWVNSSPAVYDGLVYAGSSDAHFVQAVDAATGEERWRVASSRIVWSSPAVDSATVYVGEGDGTLYALDRQTGAERWRYRVAGRIMSSPAVHAGRVYFGSDDGVYAVNAAMGAPLVRAVFWDTTYVQAPLSVNRVTLRNYLRDRGFEVLDRTSLAAFMADRTRDRAPSAVVFAQDVAPPTVAPVASDTALLRRYLDAGGTVVWLGTPPGMAPPGMQSLKDLDRSAPERLIGVGFRGGNFDPMGVTRVTPAGVRLGLPAGWLDSWGADAAGVTTVLAYDEHGQAASWVKSFGGPPGSGFIRVYSGDGDAGHPYLREIVQTAADLRPRPR